ncbi:DUF3592 domain-containing protein [Parasulfitobacter algicola]|uniref:DUF3592 domain-containing protein n=1 Tax=Parasulfitobacter algicola TaxID=2614809 RepID=A0ABX2IPU2_9RHOB|nr:DUF3592 domain-containing protein [Sulfitobacter algicola]NSX54380.1 DUF3592 domain-containing protein [Sulfitobacter algicola]
MTYNNIRWLVFAGLTFFGLIFAVIGAVFLYNQNQFMKDARLVEATVIDVEVSYSDGTEMYRPTVRYLDETGTPHEAETWWSSNLYDFDIGETVEVYYNHDHSDNIQFDSFFALWGFGLIFLIVGLVPILIGLGIFIAMGIAEKRRIPNHG